MQNTKTVLTPTTLAAEGLAVFQQRADLRIIPYNPAITPPDFHALLAETTPAAIALSFTPLTRAAIAQAPALQAAARIGVGFDAVDVPALTERGIPLFTVGLANARSVAEHAIHYIFALAKRANDMDRRVHQGVGHDRKTNLPIEIDGKTLLIIGFGRIGSRVAPRAAALGLHVLVHDPHIAPATITEAGYEPALHLDEALPRATFVTIHCPKNAETINLFDAARLARMQPGAYLINTARGGIVDETALAEALASGHLGGAGLDVFDPEPPPADHPLLQLPTVMASPHMAGITVEAWAAMAVMTAENIIGMLDGTPNLANVINPEALAAKSMP